MFIIRKEVNWGEKVLQYIIFQGCYTTAKNNKKNSEESLCFSGVLLKSNEIWVGLKDKVQVSLITISHAVNRCAMTT